MIYLRLISNHMSSIWEKRENFSTSFQRLERKTLLNKNALFQDAKYCRLRNLLLVVLHDHELPRTFRYESWSGGKNGFLILFPSSLQTRSRYYYIYFKWFQTSVSVLSSSMHVCVRTCMRIARARVYVYNGWTWAWACKYNMYTYDVIMFPCMNISSTFRQVLLSSPRLWWMSLFAIAPTVGGSSASRTLAFSPVLLFFFSLADLFVVVSLHLSFRIVFSVFFFFSI